MLFTFYWKCLWNPTVALLAHWQESKGERDTLRKCLQLCWLLSLRTEGLWLQSPSHTVRASSSRFKHDAAPFTQRLLAERIAATAVAVSSEAQQHREVKGQTQLSLCLCEQARYSESHHTMENNISLREVYMGHQSHHSSTAFSFFSLHLTRFVAVCIFHANVFCCQTYKSVHCAALVCCHFKVNHWNPLSSTFLLFIFTKAQAWAHQEPSPLLIYPQSGYTHTLRKHCHTITTSSQKHTR